MAHTPHNHADHRNRTNDAHSTTAGGDLRDTVSVIIPAYNESACIEQTLATLIDYASSQRQLRELIVVDDGSTDDTAAVVAQFAGQHGDSVPRIQLIQLENNRGKGAAVREGMFAATGDIALFTDADLSAPAEEMSKLIEPIRDGSAEVTVGSRALDRSLIGTRQSRMRETAGKFFNFLVRLITRLDIRDTQCGFKAFRLSAIRPALARQHLTRFAFDVELLFLAKKSGLSIEEIPVRWSHVHHTKVRLFRDSAHMFYELIRIRLNELRGCYRFDQTDQPARPSNTRIQSQ
jgi:glycosyltransferase involved in cell wall biosynthesis